MIALVTGALGFCGRHLIRRLAARPATTVVGVDREGAVASGVAPPRFHACDLADPGAAAALVSEVRPEVVFHLAGLFAASPPALYRANVLALVELLDAVRVHVPEAGVVVAGSAAEYGHVPGGAMPITEHAPCAPVSHYGRSKYAATLAALGYAASGVRVSVVRPFNIVGAGVPTALLVGAVLDRMAVALDRGEDDVRVGNLDCERDFVAVDDVVDGYVALAERGAWGEVFNVCAGRPVPVRSVVEVLLSWAPRPLRLVTDPALCRPDDVPSVYGSCARAREAFGFTPSTPLDAALRAAWEDRMSVQRR